jgi:hypothetical protein
VSESPHKHALSLLRRPSLAFGFGTFAYAKDRASLPHDGLFRRLRLLRPIDKFGVYQCLSRQTATKNAVAGAAVGEGLWNLIIPMGSLFLSSPPVWLMSSLELPRGQVSERSEGHPLPSVHMARPGFVEVHHRVSHKE